MAGLRPIRNGTATSRLSRDGSRRFFDAPLATALLNTTRRAVAPGGFVI
jgi:hypothetical protein